MEQRSRRPLHSSHKLSMSTIKRERGPVYLLFLLYQKTALHQELHPSEPVLLVHTEGHRGTGQRYRFVFSRECGVYSTAIFGE